MANYEDQEFSNPHFQSIVPSSTAESCVMKRYHKDLEKSKKTSATTTKTTKRANLKLVVDLTEANIRDISVKRGRGRAREREMVPLCCNCDYEMDTGVRDAEWRTSRCPECGIILHELCLRSGCENCAAIRNP